jgi:3-dehydroquinate synthase
LLLKCGAQAREILGAQTGKIALASNAKVFALYGERVRESFEREGFQVFVWLMKDGEKYKNFRVLETALDFFSANRITRADAVVALGGGVVGDLAGFAAAIHLRGIRFLNIPTTFLAMIDASVGGKTGVNGGKFGKNLTGAFHQPTVVFTDATTLQTLPRRELVAGFCEAVKHGAIGSRALFNQTAEFLENFPLKNFKKHFSDANFLNALENLLAAQIAFKTEIVTGDVREDARRTDNKSRKILNFGHTTAHALEQVTGYKQFKHGEAVGVGMRVAAEISKSAGIFSPDELNLLNGVLHRIGNPPDTRNISVEKVVEAFSFDKKTIENSLQWILLEKIGKPKIVRAEEIPKSIVKEALKKVLHK